MELVSKATPSTLDKYSCPIHIDRSPFRIPIKESKQADRKIAQGSKHTKYKYRLSLYFYGLFPPVNDTMS